MRRFNKHELIVGRVGIDFQGNPTGNNEYFGIEGFIQPSESLGFRETDPGGTYDVREWNLYTTNQDAPRVLKEVDDYVVNYTLGDEEWDGATFVQPSGEPSDVLLTTTTANMTSGTTYLFTAQGAVTAGSIVVKAGSVSETIPLGTNGAIEFQLTSPVDTQVEIRTGVEASNTAYIEQFSLKPIVSYDVSGDGVEQVRDFVWWNNRWCEAYGSSEWIKMGRAYYRQIRVQANTANNSNLLPTLRVPPPNFSEVSEYVVACNNLEIQMEYNVEPSFTDLINELNN